jgi:protein subunit release factor A
MWFCESLEFNYDTGVLHVVFGLPDMDEFAFLTKHGIFHNMKEIIPLMLNKIQQLEANIEIIANLKAKDMEAAHFKRIMHVLLDMTRAKSNEDLERLQEEIDSTTEQINIRLRPKKKAPDVDMNAGVNDE